jgi:hypothetical protein
MAGLSSFSAISTPVLLSAAMRCPVRASALDRIAHGELRQFATREAAGESGEGTNAESDRAILHYFRPFGLASRETLEGGTITGIHAMRSEHTGQSHQWLRDHSPDCPA